jgi:hypothetical protein
VFAGLRNASSESDAFRMQPLKQTMQRLLQNAASESKAFRERRYLKLALQYH